MASVDGTAAPGIVDGRAGPRARSLPPAMEPLVSTRAARNDFRVLTRTRGGYDNGVMYDVQLQVAATGWSEKRLRAAGLPVRVIHTHPFSHAGLTPSGRSGGCVSRPVARGSGQGDWSDHDEQQEASHSGAGRP